VKRYAIYYQKQCELAYNELNKPILWHIVAADREDRDILWENWKILAEKCGVLFRKSEEDDKAYKQRLIQQTIDHLAKHPGWLLLFDNALSVKQLTDYIPKSAAHQGQVLVSSKNACFWGSVEQELSLNEGLQYEEVMKLVCSYIGSDSKDSEIELIRFGDVLGRLPLALSISAQFISRLRKTRTITVSEYINTYILTTDEERKNYRDLVFKSIAERNRFYQKTQEQAILEPIKHTEPVYQYLLTCCALVDIHALNFNFVTEFIKEKNILFKNDIEKCKRTDQEELEYLLYNSDNVSLLYFTSSNQSEELKVNIHQVTASVVLKLSQSYGFDREKMSYQAFISASKILTRSIKEVHQTKHYKKIKTYFSHIRALSKNCEFDTELANLFRKSSLYGIVYLSYCDSKVNSIVCGYTIIGNYWHTTGNIFIECNEFFCNYLEAYGDVHLVSRKNTSLSYCSIKKDIYFIDCNEVRKQTSLNIYCLS